MSTPNTKVLAFEYGALFTIHQSLRFSDSVVKKDFLLRTGEYNSPSLEIMDDKNPNFLKLTFPE
jgi:hypothetical protein